MSVGGGRLETNGRTGHMVGKRKGALSKVVAGKGDGQGWGSSMTQNCSLAWIHHDRTKPDQSTRS